MKHLLYTALLAILPIIGIAQNTAESISALIPRGEDVFRWGYSELNAQERQMYDTIVGSLIRFEANNASPYYYHSCYLTGVPNTIDIQQLISMLTRVSRDIPELYILSSSIPRYDYNTYSYYARIGYVNNPDKYLDELRALRLAADTILRDITPDMSDYEKLLKLHDGFIEWGDYGDMTGADAGNIRGALLNKRAICEGFAFAGLYLCQRVGIPCIFVEVQQVTSTVNNTWGNHALNYVKLDGQWYMMDLTADGGFPNIVGHVGFLRGQAHFDESYRLEDENGTPKNAIAYNSLPTLSTDDYDPNATPPSALEQDWAHQQPRKLLINGHLVIRTDEGDYTATGQLIR